MNECIYKCIIRISLNKNFSSKSAINVSTYLWDHYFHCRSVGGALFEVIFIYIAVKYHMKIKIFKMHLKSMN